MIYTSLLEPYIYPKIIPIEVTVLRGARRMRLAYSLRRKYADFVPKIWHILARLGYQRYLQKIYISLDVEQPVTSSYYQLPLIVSILEAVGMLHVTAPVYCIGRFRADYSLEYLQVAEFLDSPIPKLQTTTLNDGEKLETFLNNLHQSPQPVAKTPNPIHSLFQGVNFLGKYINMTKSPTFILKRIPETTWRESSVYLSLRHKPLSTGLVNLLQAIPQPAKLQLEHRKCFCENTPCTCTKAEKLTHTEQLYMLRNLWK